MKYSDYNIMMRKDASELLEAVNIMFKSGYEPIGGIHVLVLGGNIFYYQAVAKVVPSDQADTAQTDQ